MDANDAGAVLAYLAAPSPCPSGIAAGLAALSAVAESAPLPEMRFRPDHWYGCGKPEWTAEMVERANVVADRFASLLVSVLGLARVDRSAVKITPSHSKAGGYSADGFTVLFKTAEYPGVEFLPGELLRVELDRVPYPRWLGADDHELLTREVAGDCWAYVWTSYGRGFSDKVHSCDGSRFARSLELATPAHFAHYLRGQLEGGRSRSRRRRERDAWRDPAAARARSLEGLSDAYRHDRDACVAHRFFVDEMVSRWGFPLNRVLFNTIWERQGDGLRLEFCIEPTSSDVAVSLCALASDEDALAPRGFWLSCAGEGGPNGGAWEIPEAEFPDAEGMRRVLADVAAYRPEGVARAA